MKMLKKISFLLLSYTCTLSCFEFTSEDSAIQSLASLTFHLNEGEHSSISFSDEEIASLWLKAAPYHDSEDFQEAYQCYYAAQSNPQSKTALLHQAYTHLKTVWNQATDAQSPLLEDSAISEQAIKRIKQYVIPYQHPMREKLDAIFKASRVTLNEDTFARAGFVRLGRVRPRSFVNVARHPELPGYLVKAYLDNELRQKRDKPSLLWLAKRCRGAEKIRHIIKERQFKYFTVPDKWIYPLPAEPAPPRSAKYTRHLAVLLVTDMELVSSKENKYAWYHRMTKKHLDELYFIISRAHGSSYRFDNIAYTKNETFAFIDTEYPDQTPDFQSVRLYLREEMRDYWDHLVKHGGK